VAISPPHLLPWSDNFSAVQSDGSTLAYPATAGIGIGHPSYDRMGFFNRDNFNRADCDFCFNCFHRSII